MSIVFQDPAIPANNLLTVLKKTIEGAEVICCAFAFASSKGIEMLFEDPVVQASLEKANTNLIVGMDAITDTQAVNRLSKLCADFEKVSAQAFIPPNGGIFHPKISWVKSGNVGTVVTGSGNLTKGGLESNFEAFSVTTASEKEITQIAKSWSEFITNNASYLFPLDSEKVKNKAEENKKLKKAVKKAKKELGIADPGSLVPSDDQVVFIEELTEGRGGKQRDVGKWAANNYFEKDIDIFLTHVDPDGEKASEKAKRISFKKSDNFAIDLDASKGVKGVDGKLPIAVFVKIAPQKYLYHVIPPNGVGYADVSDYLKKEIPSPGNNKARRLKKALTPTELLQFWPSAPFWD